MLFRVSQWFCFYLTLGCWYWFAGCQLWAIQIVDGGETQPVAASATPPNAHELGRIVRGLLSSRCFQCHGPDAATREGGFRLDHQDSYLSPADSGDRPIVPGDLSSSELWVRITSEDSSLRMPPPAFGNALTDEELSLIAQWIEQGAWLPDHWSLIAPERRTPPGDSDHSAFESWNHPIDRWVLAKQTQRGLHPSPEATPPELLRRLSLDLIGLPPSPEQVAEFEADRGPEAYERQVDRLLSSPSFGEHWARQWLDLARYADSAGYADDPDRTIWAYRDWVVRAFNDNMPIDRFTVEQIAGDLLDAPTVEQLTATAFHRNTLTNNEGGTNDEEFRNVAVVDRVNTTLAVWMGLTISCAQCHSHKYDPFTQEEYFQLFAIFNQSQDADRRDESPTLDLFSPRQWQQISDWKSAIHRNDMLLHQAYSTAASMAGWFIDADDNAHGLNALNYSVETQNNPLASFSRSRSDGRIDAISAYGHGWPVQPAESIFRESMRLQRQLDSLLPETSVPIMRDLPASQQRTTRIQLRGDYRALGDEVTANTPQVFHAIRHRRPSMEAERLEAKTNQTQTLEHPLLKPTRLELAEWLVDERNPLTARVWVNRMWESLFGIGLVRSSEEFGAQGDPPSHPELLDWLAREFMELKWDFKAMLRRMVTAQAYRQTSQVSYELLDKDRDNIWLARGPRVRLTAEMIRDVALHTSGLLSHSMYGPPVLPPQPNQGLRAAFGSETDWQPSEGENRYRRAIYTKWRRSNPYPSMGTFDAPSREVCVLRRDSTNTPLQALVTLNDPAFVEAAQAMARRLVQFELVEASDWNRIERAFRLCTSRPPLSKETEALARLLAETRSHFAMSPDRAIELATHPLGPLPEHADAIELAVWTTLCNVLLNLDEVLMKR